MSLGTVAIFLQAVAPLIPHVVRLVEQTIPGPKKGRRKRARAIKTIDTIAAGVPALVQHAAELSREVGKQIDDAVARMNAERAERAARESSSSPG